MLSFSSDQRPSLYFVPSKLDGFLLCLPEPETSVVVGSLSPLDLGTSRLLDCTGLSPLVIILVAQTRIVLLDGELSG